MRYKVPQNIDMEDRIVGPLTMVQFVTVMVGGMLVYVSYLLFTPTTFWFAAIPLALVTIAFAFLRVNDQPFPKFAAASLLFLVRPKSRIWQKSNNDEALKIVHKPNTQTARLGAESTVQRSQLDELSTILDTAGSPPIAPTPPPSIPAPVATPVTPPLPLENGTLVPLEQPTAPATPSTEPAQPGLHTSWEGK